MTFFVTAATFGAMSLWGYTTGRDLTGMGSFLFMGLIGLMLASLANMFFHSTQLQFVISVLGVLIFTGLTAYDSQKHQEHVFCRRQRRADGQQGRSWARCASISTSSTCSCSCCGSWVIVGKHRLSSPRKVARSKDRAFFFIHAGTGKTMLKRARQSGPPLGRVPESRCRALSNRRVPTQFQPFRARG